VVILDRLDVPIVQAPLAGGPSTPELAAAVSNAGGLGFVAAGYRPVDALASDIIATRALTSRPFGVNLFAPGGAPANRETVGRFADRIRSEARAAGVELGAPRFDDDAWSEKLGLLCSDPVPVVSVTFGCPAPETVAALRRAGSDVWVTVTGVAEARAATAAGVDALVVQGFEAGGHRGSFDAMAGAGDLGLVALLQLVRAAADLPLVAAGGIATGRGVAAVLAGGARAAQLGTAFMRCPEAGTSDAHRAALAGPAPTATTRAFTGRSARGVVNRFMTEHGPHAPAAYPELHHVTAPLRAHGRAVGDPDLINLWAGQAHELVEALPAGELVGKLAHETRAALVEAESRVPDRPR
jgi:nitronate monooxygenase